jgi:hypothetical protein
MSYSFVTVFGSEISVNPNLRRVETQYNGYAGANGVTGMRLGHRGYPVVVTGIARYTASTYAAARLGLLTAINTTDATHRADVENDWTYGSETYYNLVYDHMELVPFQAPDGTAKTFRWSGTYAWCRFIVFFRNLSDVTP